LSPAVDAMNTIRPKPSARMPASAGFTDRKAPVRFTASVAFHSSSDVLWAGALSAAPALATTISMGSPAASAVA
jgi:hypothetical protein